MYWSSKKARRCLVGIGTAIALATSALVTVPAAQAESPEKGLPKPLVYLAPEYSAGDLTGDLRVDLADLDALTAAIGTKSTAGAAWDTVAHDDADGNGEITLEDIAALSKQIIYNDGDFEILEASAVDIQASMAAGKLTSVELVKLYLDRIAAYDQAVLGGNAATKLSSILTINPNALAIAAELDAERDSEGPRSMLHGVPVLVKDNYNTIDMPTTIGCRCLVGNETGDDAFMVEQLRAQGAVILAKTNLAEFAFATDGVSSLARTTNAFLPGATSGGSSAGTGASISANFGVIGLGTDTGGSIRVPSAYNGLVGIRPTVGLTSRDGIAPLALSQDTGGPMTRTVADAAIALDIMAKSDPADAATAETDAKRPASYLTSLDPKGLEGARIGFVSTVGTNQSHIGTNPGVQRIFEETKATLAANGATLVDIDKIVLASTNSGSSREFGHDLDEYLAKFVKTAGLPTTTQAIVDLWEADSSISTVGASVRTRNADNTPERYADWMASHNAEIQSNRDTITTILEDNNLDAIILPPVTNFAAGGGSGYSNNRVSALSGFPSISVPSGFAKESDVGTGMTAAAVGGSMTIEFLGPRFSEAKLLKYAYAFEQATKVRKAPERFPDLLPDGHEPVAPSPDITPTFQVGLPWIDPDVGDIIHVSIFGSSIADTYAYTLKLGVDPTKLQFVGTGGAETSGFTDVKSSGSTLTLVHSKVGTSPTVFGNVVLADLVFKVLAKDYGSIKLDAFSGVGAEGGAATTIVKPPTAVVEVPPSPEVSPPPVEVPNTPATPTPTVSAIKTSTKTVYLKKGSSVKLPVVFYGSPAGQAAIAATSSKAKVATVKVAASAVLGAKSTVTIAAKKIGSSTVTIKSVNGKTLSIKVKVVAAPKAIKSVALAKQSKAKTIKVGASKWLIATAKPAKATSAVITWKSSKPSVLTVDAAGKVTAKAPGKATITAKSGKKTVKLTITVKK